MHRDILILIDRKLKEALISIDDETGYRVRELWKSITPAPSCPSSSKITTEMITICQSSLNERGEKLKFTIVETLKELSISMDEEFIKSLLELARTHYPEDVYISLVQHTKGVYGRSNAPKQKFSDRAYSLDMSRLIAGSIYSSRKTMNEVKTAVIGMKIVNESKKLSLLQRFITKYILPLGKWVTTIVAGLLVLLIWKLLGW